VVAGGNTAAPASGCVAADPRSWIVVTVVEPKLLTTEVLDPSSVVVASVSVSAAAVAGFFDFDWKVCGSS
jgi:hypothetical protein